MLSATANIVLVAVHVLSACIWVGGFVAIGVVSHVAGGQLTPAARVTFFRALGRAYGAVAGAALLVALAMGAVLISERPWDAATTVGVLLACALVLITLVAVVQARRMTCLRERALTAVLEPTLRAVIVRRAAVATVLRGAIGLLTVALVVVGVIMVTATPADHARRLGSASSSPTGGAGLPVAKRWTADEDRELRRRYEAGQRVQAVAVALGRSPDAVTARRRRLGIVPRRGSPWSAREDALVRSAVLRGVPATVLAAYLDRPSHAVRQRRLLLVGRARDVAPYQPSEDQAIPAALPTEPTSTA